MTIKCLRDAFIRGLTAGLKNPSGRGERIIVLHIGSDDGFLEGGQLVFQSKKTCDYHEEMNADVFEKWFLQVLPLLEPNSVIVLDNASYHSRYVEKIPNTSSRKDEIIQWLVARGVNVDQSYLKAELLLEVEKLKPAYQRRRIDVMAEQHGHTVLRLPPYHCELNPIELIWAAMKQYVARLNKTFKMTDLKILLQESITKITPELWRKCIQHVVEKVEPDMWDLGEVMDRLVEVKPMIINIGPDDSDSDDSIEAENNSQPSESDLARNLAEDSMDIDEEVENDSGIAQVRVIDCDWDSD